VPTILLLEKRNKTIKGMKIQKDKRLKEVPSINFGRHSVTSLWGSWGTLEGPVPDFIL
jgi:hypothetical protein